MVEAIAEEVDAVDAVKPVLVEITGPAAVAEVEMVVAVVEVVTMVGVTVAADTDPPMADMAEAPATATLVDQAVEDKVGGEEATRAINPLALSFLPVSIVLLSRTLKHNLKKQISTAYLSLTGQFKLDTPRRPTTDK